MFSAELSLLIRIHTPIIYVIASEEERAEQVICQTAQNLPAPREVVFYDVVRGFGSE